MEWVATADDPIGMLVTQKFKRDRQGRSAGNAGANSGDNAMVSEALNYLGIRYRFGGSFKPRERSAEYETKPLQSKPVSGELPPKR